jgi:hypothetical protein
VGTHPRRRSAPAPLPEIEWIDDEVVDPRRVPTGVGSVRRGHGPLPRRPHRTAPVGITPAGATTIGGTARHGSVAFGSGASVADPAVHRLLRRPVGEALDALEALHDELLTDPARPRGSWVRWRRRRAWLAFDDPSHGRDGDGCRVPARLRVPWAVRLVEVELVVEPWSASWTELRLQLAGHRSVWRLPHGYFDTAHPLMASLRDALAARI